MTDFPEPLTTCPASLYPAVLGILHAQMGCDFSLYKQSTILRRLQRRKDQFPERDWDSYVEFLEADSEEQQNLFFSLLIGVTEFFRDPESFDALGRELRSWLSSSQAPRVLRVWVPACSTGEEVYSLSILLREAKLTTAWSGDIQIFASDLDTRAIEIARRGWYSEAALQGVSAQRLSDWFEQDKEGWRVKKTLREGVVFAPQNLLADPPYPHIDLLSCRNFLIYLNGAVQKALTMTFAYALESGGFLFLGNSESISTRTVWFEVVDKRARIYRRTSAFRPQISPVQLAMPLKRDVVLTRPVPEPSQDLKNLVFEQVTDKHFPPCALVDTQGDIQFLWGDTAEIFHRRSGKPSHQIVENMIDPLRIPVANALAEAVRQKRRQETGLLRWDREAGRACQITVYPIEANFLSGQHYLFVFEKQQILPDSEVSTTTESQQRLEELEQELVATRLYLKNTVQKLEQANELLKASNEEAQSMNEELQSANEELESSKEELQAANDELGNLNSAYANRIEELSRLNNDVFNFIHSARIGMVFVDRELKIWRFTPETAQVFPLIESDLGRSITAFSGYFGLRIEEPIQQVLRDLTPWEQELQTSEGQIYLHRILPYRTLEERIEGVVMTFTDVSILKKTEQKLQESEDKYRALFENLPVPVLACEALQTGSNLTEFVVLGANPAFHLQFAGLFEVPLGQQGEKLMEDLGRDFREGIARVLQSQNPESRRFYSQKLKKYWQTWIYPSGNARFAVIFDDVTDQTVTLEALQLSEDLYRSTLISIDDFVSVLDKDGRYLDFFQSKKAGALFPFADFTGPEAQFPEVQQALKTALHKLTAGEPVQAWTFTLPTATGERFFSSRMSPRLASDGSLNGAVVVTRDITDLVRAQKAAVEGELQFRALFEAAPLGFFQIENGKLKRVNVAFAKMFGYLHEEDLLGRRWDDFLTAESLTPGRLLESAGLREPEKILGGELVGRKKDGTVFPLRIDLAGAPYEGNVLLIGAAQDLTERHRMEMSVLNSQRLESLGVLAGGIAHDFNNLLGGVFGYLELAQHEAEKDSKTYRYLQKALSVFRRAQDLTRQLITFAKGGQPVKKLIDLRRIAEETARFVLSGGNVRLVTHFPEDLWWCEADSGQLSQVIDNLVINARQAMPNGGTVTLSAHNVSPAIAPPQLVPGPYVELIVADTGPGIAKEILPRIFDPFFSTKKEGSGLGLATVYSVVTKHGGWIEAESRNGAVFHIWLPALIETPLVPSVPSPVKVQRILVLDDEESLRDVTGAFLEAMGYRVVCTASGEEAIQEFLQARNTDHPFGFALVDLTIPGEKGGLEVVKELRKHQPDLKAAAMSGYSRDDVMSDPNAFGLVGCLSKPFTRQELQTFLELHYPLADSSEV